MSLNTKLVIGAITVAIATVYLAYLGASSSWQYYVHVDECVAQQPELIGRRLRVNGRIAAASLQIREDRQSATFVLRGRQSEISVICGGPLPDNLAEEMDVVVEGRLDGTGHIQGDKVLTRCASKYQADLADAPEGTE